MRRRLRRTCVRQSWRPIIPVGALPPPHARSSAVPRRCITPGPPMCLDLRHSFDDVIHSFASGRKRYRRSTVNLKAITNRPEVSAWSQRVRLDPECERGGLLTHDRNMGWRQFVPQGRPRGLPQPSGTPPSQRLTRRGRLERNRGFSCRVRSDDHAKVLRLSELTEDPILQKAKDLCRSEGKAWSVDDLKSRVPGVSMVTVVAEDNDRTEYLNRGKALLANE